MRGQRWGIGAAVVLLLAIAAVPARGQTCLGVPLAAGQTTLAVRAGFLDNANRFGLRAANRISGPITVGVSYWLTNWDYENVDSDHTVGLEASYDLPVAALEDAGFSLCPAVRVEYTTRDAFNTLHVPIGVGIGGNLEVGDGLGLAPYIFPALHWQRLSNGGSSTTSDFGFNGGANLLVNNLYFGAFIEKVGDGDLTFGVQGGINF